jgi:DNA-directed RNA polymerase sigma subunit (sigma70/sigma32)
LKNFTNSDYALNKGSVGIVYTLADGNHVTVTLEAYLAENPDKTADDFRALKAFSDGDYHEQDRRDYRNTWKNIPLDGVDDLAFMSIPSPEAEICDGSEEEEIRRILARNAFDKLTDIQRKRYLMYHVKGLTTREIATIDAVSHQSVVECLAAAEKKIKKFLAKA